MRGKNRDRFPCQARTSAEIRDVSAGLEGDVEEVQHRVCDERRHLLDGTLDPDLRLPA
jgi:hypothetical protein